MGKSKVQLATGGREHRARPWLESLHADTQGRAGNSDCDLLGSMQLEQLRSAGVGEALTKIFEGLPLLNEL